MTDTTASTLAQAESLLAQGLLAQARAVLEAAVEAEPTDVRLRFALGTCLNAQGERTAAIIHLNAVVHASPTHAAAAYELGCALQAVGRFTQAVAAFQRALSHGDIPDASERLRVCQAALGRAAADGSATAEPSSPAAPTAEPAAAPSVAPLAPSVAPAAAPSIAPDAAPSVAPVALSDVSAAAPSVAPAAPLEGTVIARPSQSPHSLAESLDADRPAEPGEVRWSTRTRPRHNAPTAIVATLVFIVAMALINLPAWIMAPLGLYAAAAWVAVAVISALSEVTFYERRVDISHGFPQKRVVIWYASIVEVGYDRSVTSYLTDTASLRIDYSTNAGTRTSLVLEGIGRPAWVSEVFEELQGPVIRERRAMKKILAS